jgi:hypothetical protein
MGVYMNLKILALIQILFFSCKEGEIKHKKILESSGNKYFQIGPKILYRNDNKIEDSCGCCIGELVIKDALFWRSEPCDANETFTFGEFTISNDSLILYYFPVRLDSDYNWKYETGESIIDSLENTEPEYFISQKPITRIVEIFFIDKETGLLVNRQEKGKGEILLETQDGKSSKIQEFCETRLYKEAKRLSKTKIYKSLKPATKL